MDKPDELFDNIIDLQQSKELIVNYKWMKKFPDDIERIYLETQNELGIITKEEKTLLKWKRKFPNTNTNARAYLEAKNELGSISHDEKVYLNNLRKFPNDLERAFLETQNELNKLSIEDMQTLRHKRKLSSKKPESKDKKSLEIGNVSDKCIQKHGKVIDVKF